MTPETRKAWAGMIEELEDASWGFARNEHDDAKASGTDYAIAVIREHLLAAEDNTDGNVTDNAVLAKIVEEYRENGHDMEYCGHAVRHILKQGGLL